MSSKTYANGGAEQDAGGELDGLTFVFDGSTSKRDWAELVERHGDTVAREVSSSTDYLVVGDDPEQPELDDACEYDVPVITEYEFGDLLQTKGVDSQMAGFS
ncbi:BRCT domain-containing protein [Natrialba aegyptia]|uniref:NAD-dependent DNA ligase LigA n=1 Tax=Natrialba aegyptia DSM 13077 TaxID=1227491 RepID=M0BAU8_9EURY|nr:BRCT domain-containing protein [Natrialba aegyptia]ELZ06794.1 NAD-dependent DNA ligase LigA [Natrialba aegyptia DSM 13077]